jgi:hypothetical protein
MACINSSSNSRPLFLLLKGRVSAGAILAVFLYDRGSWWLAAAYLSKIFLWHSKRVREMCCVVICQVMTLMEPIASPPGLSSSPAVYLIFDQPQCGKTHAAMSEACGTHAEEPSPQDAHFPVGAGAAPLWWS